MAGINSQFLNSFERSENGTGS